ncbi:hypothetical protein vB_PsyM_KIL4_0132 [Pseudomonas phage vB_PsyM_KIL4]|uniref:Uncharacterized protein n=1 Tax=Pseudomonas phage vB_PsyM_KIL4 TaxID=1777069 RepID=A0A142IF51_9CAUD|nr:hypothetical protein FDI83_gp081 [Pseudomonas phage vB_PsyM_KIL4]AMR57856.1 hypothetical protein vB_PsyM_KIL4_0132 [Pseudomonas phage vB_PsyM_KIL4]
MTPNNISRLAVKRVALTKGWGYEARRNVVVIKGEKWSFSQSNFGVGDCRQCYEDTVGFVTESDGVLYCKRIADKSSIGVVSRLTPSGLKAYSIKIKLPSMKIL